MLRYPISILLCLLFTCGPAQDSTVEGDVGQRVERQEALFHSAYGALDAAILQRVLHDSFRITYTHPPAEKDKERFIGELGELRTIFPDLELSVDSLAVDTQAVEEVTVEGSRTFSWQYGGQPGSYAERYRHHWVPVGREYLLLRAEVLPTQEE